MHETNGHNHSGRAPGAQWSAAAVLGAALLVLGCQGPGRGEDIKEEEVRSRRLPLCTKYIYEQQQKLTAPDGANGDSFGRLGLSNNSIIVGAPNDDDRGSNSGSAYTFTRSGTIWSLQQKLTASDGSKSDWFGGAVGISGDWAVMGASNDVAKGKSSGSAYVFSRSGAVWTQRQKLIPPGLKTGDAFGNSADMDNNTMVLGAQHDDAMANASGTARIYVRSSTTWVHQQEIFAADGGALDRFGAQVSVDGNTVVASAPYDDDRGSSSGSVYVFSRSGLLWGLQQKLTASDGAANDYFGRGVHLDGETLAVGALYDDDRGGNAGSVYVYTRSGATWTQQQKLTASDGAAGDEFGDWVNVRGDTLTVSATAHDSAANNGGATYVFNRSGSTWTQNQKLVAADAGSNWRLGRAAVGQGFIVSTAFLARVGSAATGAAYSFGEVCAKANGTACTGDGECDSGHCVDGVCCNLPCGGGVPDCQACSITAGAPSNGACAMLPTTTICRTAASACDVAENCDGATAVCPADAVRPTTFVCRTASGDCDVAENCDGSTKTCPADAVRPTTHVCRTASGVCDLAENCDGSAKTCPGDFVQPTSHVCRTASGACDLAENCDGSAKTCPADAVQPTTHLCRTAGGACDLAESCDGSAKTCPADGFQPSTVSCRVATQVCDITENCSGAAATCPADAVQPTTHLCRIASGVCDLAESCNGSTKACPADAVQPTTHVCRAASSACDVAENCDGVTAFCTADLVQSTTHVCRAASGACDLAENCSGTTKACPADIVLPTTHLCRTTSGACDVAENCDGKSPACPNDSFQPGTMLCRNSAGTCDLAEHCTGNQATCPLDSFQPGTTLCRTSHGECDWSEFCPGNQAACPKDLYKSNGTPCAVGTGSCQGGKCLLNPDSGPLDQGVDGLTDGGLDQSSDGAVDSGGADMVVVIDSSPDVAAKPETGTPDTAATPETGTPDTAATPETGAPDTAATPETGTPDKGIIAPETGTPDKGIIAPDTGTPDLQKDQGGKMFPPVSPDACSCRLNSAPSPGSFHWGALLLATLLGLRRRRGKRPYRR